MLARVYTCAVIGLDAQVVEVEVDTGRGLPSFFLVGMPDAAVKESSERIRSAIKNSGLHLHGGRITVNLAPADLRKAGPAYDLPIAVGILVATDQAPPDALHRALFLGQLSLDGSVRHVRGVLPVAAFAATHGFHSLFAPRDDAVEAALIEGVNVIPVGSLSELVEHLQGTRRIAPQPLTRLDASAQALPVTDFKDIRGQQHVKRAMEVAAAGAHNVFMLWTKTSSIRVDNSVAVARIRSAWLREIRGTNRPPDDASFGGWADAGIAAPSADNLLRALVEEVNVV